MKRIFCIICITSVVMAQASCHNNAKDGDETDIDCGGSCVQDCDNWNMWCTACSTYSCGRCDITESCNKDEDCTVRNSKTINGQDSTWDIHSHEQCYNEICIGCNDEAKNGDETDIDCGGSICTKCALNKICVEHTDCAEPFSVNWGGISCDSTTKKCISCDDGVKNGDETVWSWDTDDRQLK